LTNIIQTAPKLRLEDRREGLCVGNSRPFYSVQYPSSSLCHCRQVQIRANLYERVYRDSAERTTETWAAPATASSPGRVWNVSLPAQFKRIRRKWEVPTTLSSTACYNTLPRRFLIYLESSVGSICLHRMNQQYGSKQDPNQHGTVWRPRLSSSCIPGRNRIDYSNLYERRPHGNGERIAGGKSTVQSL